VYSRLLAKITAYERQTFLGMPRKVCRSYAVIFAVINGLASRSTRTFTIFPYLFVPVPCARLGWPSRQLLSARKSTVSYRIVSYMLCVDNDREVDHDALDSTSPLYGHPRRSLAGKNRLHRTRVGIELDRLPDHVTTHTGNTSRKRRSTSAGSEYEAKSSAEIIRRCEQWLNDVRRATTASGLTAGHIASVTTSGCEQAAVDIDTY